eukprot:4709894-Alexandrium_andersonii.AAC.1
MAHHALPEARQRSDGLPGSARKSVQGHLGAVRRVRHGLRDGSQGWQADFTVGEGRLARAHGPIRRTSTWTRGRSAQ